MSNSKCSQCGAPIEVNRTHCKYCGGQYNFPSQTTTQSSNTGAQPTPHFHSPVHNELAPGIDPSWPIKSKGLAAFLAFFFGGLGIHKFYLGQPWMGLLYFVFGWSAIPSVIGMLEAIVYLLQSKHNFQVKNCVRLN